MTKLVTTISLPPGALAGEVFYELLHLCFEEFRWFEPRRYGSILADKKLEDSSNILGTLVSFFIEEGKINIADRAQRNELFFLPDKLCERTYSGSINWYTPVKTAADGNWRMNHAKQIIQVMKLVGSPVTFAALEDNISDKTNRWIREGAFETQIPTVRDYAEGLAGIFWRNFYGPPFSRMFGDRLKQLPETVACDLGYGYWLVEPYDRPEKAATEEGRQSEQDIIARLGPEHFYNFATNTLPRVRPNLDKTKRDG